MSEDGPVIQCKVRVSCLNGLVFDLGSHLAWNDFMRQLLLDRYIMTGDALIPFHGIAALQRMDGPSGAQMMMIAGTAGRA